MSHASIEPVTAIRINHVHIGEAAIRREMEQHTGHPLQVEAAKRALVVRELLRQRAQALGMPVSAGAEASAADDELIETLIDREATVPEPGEAECRRFYAANPARFTHGEVAEVRHILFAVTPGAPLNALRARAEQVLLELRGKPALFAERAAELSNCPSGKVGGSLGQIGRDDCAPEFSKSVFEPGPLGVLPRLVKTRFGFHVVFIERRIEGRLMPFDAVRPQIEGFLAERVSLKAAQQYVMLLAGAAEIEGVAFESATSALVQ